MPMHNIPITEITDNVTDRVARQIADAVLIRLGVRDLVVDDFYFKTDSKGASLAVDRDSNINLTRTRCDVVAETIMNPKLTKWNIHSFKYVQAYANTVRSVGDFVPLFSDKVADVYVNEHFVPCTVKLNFTLQFKNREDAYMLSDSLTQNYDGEGTVVAHDVTYAYPLSMGLAAPLMEVYKLRKSLHPTLPYLAYLQAGMANVLTVETNRDAIAPGAEPAKQLMIKRQVLSCIGQMDYDQERPEVVRIMQTSDRYSVTFTYYVQFARPAGLRLYHPVVIENQLIPDSLVPHLEPTNEIAVLEGILQEKSLTKYLREVRKELDPSILLVRFPEFDDFALPRSRIIDYTFLHHIIAAFTLEDTGDTTTLPLSDLDGITFHPVVKEIMLKHGQELFGATGLFNFTAYANDGVIDPSRLTLNPDFSVTIAATDRMKRYHFSISEAQDMQYVDPKWLDLLLEYRWYFPATIVKNLQRLVDEGLYHIEYGNELINILERCMRSGQLDGFLAQLVVGGHAGSEIFQFATAAFQLADYICNHRSRKTGRWLFDELADLGIAAGCIDHIPDRYVGGRDGYPINGGKGAYNTPLRILSWIISTAR